MPSVELSEKQVIDLVAQLPSDQKRTVLMALAEQAQVGRDRRMEVAEEQVRLLCRDRGLDWDSMTAEQREEFLDDLVHEDRPCLPQ